jgi:hypothetical protein
MEVINALLRTKRKETMKKRKPKGRPVKRNTPAEVEIEVFNLGQRWDDIVRALDDDSTADLRCNEDSGIIRLSRSEGARLMRATKIPAAIIAAIYLEAPWLIAKEVQIKMYPDESRFFFHTYSREPYVQFKFSIGLFEDPRLHPYHTLWLWETLDLDNLDVRGRD